MKRIIEKALLLGSLFAVACSGSMTVGGNGGTGGGTGGAGGIGGGTGGQGGITPPPTGGTYVRGSLQPIYGLTPRSEYGRVEQVVNGVETPLQDADFTTTAVGSTTASSKMDELGLQIQQDNGLPSPVNLIPDAADRQRAQLIPFRGNPSDIKAITVGGQHKLYVPLGGDVMTPGNEVASVSADGTLVVRTRIRVGIRPLRVAIHPAGLVFVCNEYSNYISVIDPVADAPLMYQGKPVEIKTEYYCSDLIFVPRNPGSANVDQQYLYVANRARGSVLKYQADIVRDPVSNQPVSVVQNSADPTKPIAEILGVGHNPWRLTLAEQQDGLYVANNKGGEIARIDIPVDTVQSYAGFNSPTADIVNINDLLFVPTTMPDRGFLSRDDQQQGVPQQVLLAPISVMGVDNQLHVANPGSIFDNTRSYNFEDVRNGMFQIDFRLQQIAQTVYYTDNVSAEPNFAAQTKVLAGALPTTVVRNAAGTQLFVAMGGSDLVQLLNVNTAARPFTVTDSGKVFQTEHRPFGLFLNEQAGILYVANWGSETLQAFDVNGAGQALQTLDLGYAQPTYPATNIESGELFFYEAAWSGNGRKACGSCHFDELDSDGVGFSNGAMAPTWPHEVKPNHNLGTTNSYFWNGSFGDGNYTSLAFAAQTRTNCENIAFALIEGPASNPNLRVGDPNNVIRGNDAVCRPQAVDPTTGLPANFAQIQAEINNQKAVAAAHVQQTTGLNRDELSRVIDAYAVSELRLPANPLGQLFRANSPVLGDATKQQIMRGQQLFQQATCSSCHDPNNLRHPFTDGVNHGSGADWLSRFVSTYQNDPRITGSIGTFSQTLLDGIASASTNDHEVNIYTKLDYFVPFCFDQLSCLEFDDPLAVRGQVTEETRRLNLIIQVNLEDPDRTFIPGNVVGINAINTPSLRGVWASANFLHHGLAHSIREAILGPGHPALHPGEQGWAADAVGLDSHGNTKSLSKDDVDALVRYVESIE